MSVIEVVLKAFETDPEGASVLVDEAVGDLVLDILARDEATLQSELAHRVAATVALAKRALARSYVETMVTGHYPDDEVHQTARWLADIDTYTKAVLEDVSKAFGRRRERWQLSSGQVINRDVARDPTGRFAHTITTEAQVPAAGAPNPSPAIRRELGYSAAERQGNYQTLSEDRQRMADRHQAQWEQADRYGRELAEAYQGRRDGVNLTVRYLRGDRSQASFDVPLKTVRQRGLDVEQVESKINPLADTILSVHVTAEANASADVRNDVARFNTLGALDESTLGRLAGTRGADWTAALAPYDRSQPPSRITQLAANLTGASAVLGAVPGGEKAARFAELAGQLGPQAELALGPHVRRAAYRYRGTEKTPDAELRRDYASDEMRFVRGLADAAPAEPRGDVLERTLGRRAPGRRKTPVEGAALYRTIDSGVGGDQLKMQVAADVAASHLVSALPPGGSLAAKLSEKAGHVLPSHGVLLDADGRLVSQAVGYADDHYLPFDLRNIGRLRGGQYVRTRVQGGLTGEDIYAAVQSGARMVTVVSSSGVYSMELDPSFRGARGNSDKARAMYGRYLQILDAVEGSGLYLQDITAPEKDKLRADVRELYPDDNDAEYKTHYEAALERARRDAASGIDPTELLSQAQEKATEELPRGSNQERARRTDDIYEDLKRQALEGKVDRLALNAQGYQVALETLQQQFPYFIRKVSYEPLTNRGKVPGFFARRALDESPALGRASGAEDRGYVQPGRLRPGTVSSGFYAGPANEAERLGLPGSPKRPEKAPGETTAAASGGAAPSEAAGGKPPVAGAAPPAAGGALLAKLAALKGKAANEAAEATKAMALAVDGLPPTAWEGRNQSWAAVRDGDKLARAQVLLGKPGMLKPNIADPRALEALEDREAVKTAFNSVFGEGIGDEISSDASLRARFGDATNADQIATWLAEHARRIADAATLADPFTPEAADPAFTVGARPQAFSDLMNLATSQQLAAFAKQPLGQRLESLRADGISEGQVRAAVEVLKKAHDAVPDALTRARDPNQGPWGLDLLAQTAGGMTADQLTSVLGGGGVGLADPEHAQEQLQRRALDIQKAWTLDQVHRSVEELERPKGPGPVSKDGPESWSRRAQVLDWQDPLVLPVLLAKAAGRLPSRRHQL